MSGLPKRPNANGRVLLGRGHACHRRTDAFFQRPTTYHRVHEGGGGVARKGNSQLKLCAKYVWDRPSGSERQRVAMIKRRHRNEQYLRQEKPARPTHRGRRIFSAEPISVYDSSSSSHGHITKSTAQWYSFAVTDSTRADGGRTSATRSWTPNTSTVADRDEVNVSRTACSTTIERTRPRSSWAS